MEQRKPKVLFVDDEENILRSLRRLFRRQPWTQEFAGSGAAALEAWERCGPFDLVVTDQRMPGMTGVDLLREIRALRPESIRIVLSGYADFQSVLDAVNEGAIYKFLTKPWDDEVLRRTLAEALELPALRGRCDALQRELEQQNQALLEANQMLQESFYSGERQASLSSSLPIILDALPVGVLVLGPGGQLMQANETARHLVGGSCDQSPAGVVDPEDLSRRLGLSARSTPPMTLPDGPQVTVWCLWEE